MNKLFFTFNNYSFRLKKNSRDNIFRHFEKKKFHIEDTIISVC